MTKVGGGIDLRSKNCTLKTGIPVEEGDSILKLLWRVFRPETQLGVGIHSELDIIFSIRNHHFYYQL